MPSTPHPRLDSGQRSVGPGADLQVRHLRGGRVCGLEVLAPREDEPDGPLQRERGSDRQRLDEGELASEGATERLRDHADAVER